MPLFNRESCQLDVRWHRIYSQTPHRIDHIGRPAFIDPGREHQGHNQDRRDSLFACYAQFRNRNASAYSKPPETLGGFVREVLSDPPDDVLLRYFPEGEVWSESLLIGLINGVYPLAGLMGALTFVDYSIDEEGTIPDTYYVQGYEPEEVIPEVYANESRRYSWHDPGYRDLIGPLTGTDHSQPTYGVEIECYCEDGADDIAVKAHEFEQTFAAEDGSLSEEYGGEVITGYSHKDRILEHLSELTPALRNYNIEAPTHTDDPYGLHIHRSRKDLNNYHLVRMFNLVRNMHSNNFLQHVAGRDCGEYQYMLEESDVVKALRYGSVTERYRVINTTGHTVEIRMFHSTLSMARLTYRIEFVDAVCAFVKTTCGMKPTTWGFLSYLHRNKDRWPELAAHANRVERYKPRYGRVLHTHHHATQFKGGYFSVAA